MEESQQVKKLENLKFIVLLGDKNSPTGLKDIPNLKQEKKPMKSSMRVMSKTKTGIRKFACLNFYYNSKGKIL